MGDFLSDSSGLGYAGGALLVTGLLARPPRAGSRWALSDRPSSSSLSSSA
ncbi:MAG: hypothetical protein ABW022_26380 [Actinoplanes sp.]